MSIAELICKIVSDVENKGCSRGTVDNKLGIFAIKNGDEFIVLFCDIIKDKLIEKETIPKASWLGFWLAERIPEILEGL